MKIACGKWRDERHARRNAKLAEWHRVFLWWPMTLGLYDCRWLEFIERRRVWVECPYSCFSHWKWEFRAVQKENV
jgi:hypothetical protein